LSSRCCCHFVVHQLHLTVSGLPFLCRRVPFVL
jgi:hypothetical protein